MWVDESGNADTTDTTATPEDMTVTIEGEEYTLDTTVDLNNDGDDDTAVVRTESGALAFTDTDGDGDADMGAQLDGDGNVIATSRYDEASGTWHRVEEDAGDDPQGPAPQTSASTPMTADLPEGDIDLGPATADTNNDGVNDTAVVTDDAGNTIAFTDVNGDGSADMAVVIDPQGNATTLEHTGDGEWTEKGADGPAATDELAERSADSLTGDAAWGGEARDSVDGVARIDSATGQWISPN